MKIYQEQKEDKKSWAIKLDKTVMGNIAVFAVDSETGNQITEIIKFDKDGTVVITRDTENFLEAKGYDPNEHRNTFDRDGCIIVK